MKRAIAKNVDEYIGQFPPAVQKKLQQIRQVIKKTAPKADEMISYGIAGYKYHGMLIYFAGFTNHVSVYPAPRTHTGFKKELSAYAGGKGTVQFPLDKSIPVDLVKRIVQFKLKENEAKAGIKKTAVTATKASRSKKPSESDQVKSYMDKLAPAVKKEIDAVRKIIKAASSKLNERIKWNAPSYYYREDMLTFGPYKKDQLLLVVHHPAIEKISSPILQGNFRNRRLIYFKNSAEAAKNKKELTRIINEIIKSIEKNNH